jgi:hypothetical protein
MSTEKNTVKNTRKKSPQGIKVSKEFIFKLTEKEFAELGKKAAKLDSDIIRLDNEFDEVKKQWKAKIDAKNADRMTISMKINAGEEKRTMDSVLVKDFDAREIRYYVDGKVIESRTMTDNELQMGFDDAKLGVKKTLKTKDAGKAIAEVTGKKAKDVSIADVIKMETGRKTKHSAVDGVKA